MLNLFPIFPAFPDRPAPAQAPAGSPSQEELTQNEIDYLGRGSQAEIDYLGRDSQAEIDYLGRDAQNEIDYSNNINGSDWWLFG